MPHPIYGAPQHELERVDFTLVLPVRSNQHRTTLHVYGRAGTARPSLWDLHETWSWTEQEAGYQPSDAVAHAVLVAMQDRPTSQQQIEACMIGEGWTQLQLDL